MIVLASIGMCAGNITMQVNAAEIRNDAAIQIDSNISVIADVIVMKYRYYQGKLQYRCWNETRGE